MQIQLIPSTVALADCWPYKFEGQGIEESSESAINCAIFLFVLIPKLFQINSFIGGKILRSSTDVY